MQVSKNLFAKVNQYILLVCVALMVSGCAVRMDNVHRVSLDDDITYILQPIPETLTNTGIQALFNIKQGSQQGKENQFMIQVEMTTSRLLVSAYTVEGFSLFTLDWHTDVGTLVYDKKIAIDPLRVLAELQLVLWPSSDVAQGLEQGQLKVLSVTYREISSNNDVIYQIKQQDNISQLTNVKADYSIVIEELDRWSLLDEKLDGKSGEKLDENGLVNELTSDNMEIAP
ncbi:MAG: DUF3261 domain-containing protein [Colwellia sp.]|uniref:DUF3261 domain-containing protein n=1 Tax=Colwellia sp. TaxID=56799 RepID=UPI001DEA7533|nr:DUF3261 domain-containing protein [Colwellia sp.]NQY50885.1 DUF3261 domain-containing protein [Colwellia sp.]